MRRVRIVGLFAATTACAPRPLGPALFSPQLTNDRSVVVGRVLGAAVPDADGWPHIVVVDSAGRPYQLLVRLLVSPRMGMGDRVTAWCHGGVGELVADSLRVDQPAP